MSKPKKVEKQLTDGYAQYLRELIEEAGRVDAGREVFGAEKHQYRINPVVNMAEIRRAEEERHVKFPEEYVFYLTKVGNGGAGPDYGLYPFEKVLAEDRNPYLGQIFEQTVTTQLTKEQWREHMRKLDELGESFETDTDYERYKSILFSNMMPIGTQGCTLDNMLMLSGGDADRIMYIDWDMEEDGPPFDTGMTFLEWMEGYFEDIIDGCQMGSYGYRLRRTQQQVLEQYSFCRTLVAKRKLLDSLFRLKELGDETIDFLEELAFEDEEVTDVCCAVLLQMKQEKGLEVFGRLLAEKRISAICNGISSIRRLPMEVRPQFYRQALQILEEIQSEEGKSVYRYLMDCEQFRAGDIVGHVRRINNKELLRTAIYAMGNAKDALDYVDLFIGWMKSEDYWIAHTALQAMSHKMHEKLMPVYRWMDEKYKEDSTMQSNL
ncbi:MAG: SMI1/KNR4 family protein, partial [Acetatifactor sp.]|nr:SMI1/KNR4 family protein [Acetatifactor sp.]